MKTILNPKESICHRRSLAGREAGHEKNQQPDVTESKKSPLKNVSRHFF